MLLPGFNVTGTDGVEFDIELITAEFLKPELGQNGSG
jgi:hypothetical protein